METALRGRFDGAMRVYTGVGDKNIPSSCVVASIFRAIDTENQFTRVRRDRTSETGVTGVRAHRRAAGVESSEK